MKNKKAAMEMSVGTIVTIVLLMSVLVLGLMLTKNIFDSSNKAITGIDEGVSNEVNNLFKVENQKLSVLPKDARATIKKGDTGSKGFAFSVRNNLEETHEFTYNVIYVQDSCGIGSTGAETLFEFKSYPTGTFNLGSGETLDSAKKIFFKLTEGVPLCTIEFLLKIDRENNEPYHTGEQIFLTIK